ncbi:hypothetical protein B0H14DRAFT_629431 [Mycena olivaceomarginata]|nr:hypothetical protein B0H14DRAFT_629431 [Mycena olivaceomarginata]
MSSLAADRARVADLDAQILLLERSDEAPWELRSEKQLVQQRLDSYRYPVLALPTEIIAGIFVHFLPIYPACPPLLGLRSPTIFTQICRHWREIALETAALWRAISLTDPRISFKRQNDLCNMWLRRSRCYPLSLDLDEDAIDPFHATEALSLLVPHRARWQHLELLVRSPSHLLMFEGPTPLLSSLRLSLPAIGLPTFKFLFQEVPLLRTVVLDDYAAKKLALPWAQLTALTLHRVFPRECVPILQHASNLVHCELNLINDGVGVPDITLPSLRSLTLTGRSVTGYLETLVIPALRNLKIPESFLEPNCVDTLSTFAAKSGCKLEELCVTGEISGSKDSYCQAFPLAKVSFDG